MTFSILLCTCVNVVQAATTIKTGTIAVGNKTYTFALSGDGSSTTYSEKTEVIGSDSVSGSSTGSSNSFNDTDYSSTSTTTNTTHSITIIPADRITEGIVSSEKRATYQIDLKFVIPVSYGVTLDYTNLYRFSVNAASCSAYYVLPEGASASLVNLEYTVDLQGEEYVSSGRNFQFWRHTTNATYFYYVVEATYIVTTSSGISDSYTLGVTIGELSYTIQDYGEYNSSDDLKGSVDSGNDLQEEGNKLQEDANALQQEGNKLQENTNTLQQEGNKLQEDLNDLQTENNKLQEDANDLQSENNKLQEDANDLQSENNKLQEDANDLQSENNILQEENNKTTNNIFSSLTDFFGSFFENLIGVFVPEDGYFTNYFSRLNKLFSDKLGMLYEPIYLLIDLLNTIMNAEVNDYGIYFPGLRWENVYIIQPQTISISDIYDDFPDLQMRIYFVSDVIMVGAVVMLLQNKLKEILTT